MHRLKTVLFVTTTAGFMAGGLAFAQTGPKPADYPKSTEWPTYGHNSGATRFSPLKEITPANVGNLKQAWVYHMKPEGWQPPAGGGRGGGGGGRGAPAADDDAPAGGGRGGAPGAGRGGAPAAGAPGAAPAAGAPPAQAGAPGAPGAGGGGAGRGGAPAAAGPVFNASEGTPIIINGIMYLSTPYGRVVALDSTTGKEVWVHTLAAGNPSTRGVEYFAGDATTPALIVVTTSNSQMFTLDAKTGALNTGFGENGYVALDKAPTSPPIVVGDIIVVGGRASESTGPGVPGDVYGYSIRNGQKAWTFHTIPQKGEPNYGISWVEASTVGRSGVNVWGSMSADVERGIVYLPLGAPGGDLFGGDRPGDNLYGTSLVAVDAKTGKYIWHFQVVRHDIWDYDLGQPAVLFDVKQGNRTIPALSIVSKSALMYILDRTTGKPIYGVEERAVPTSKVPGEKTAATQQFPLKPGPISRNSFTAADLNNLTPEFEAACKKLVADNNVDLERPPFSPNSWQRSAVNFPSQIGGPNWGGSSYNPDLGYVFVNANELGQIIATTQPTSGPVNVETMVGNVPGGRQGPYAGFGPGGRFAVRDANNNLIPCNKTPWGSLTAVNVNTGEIVWKSPLGITEGLPEAIQNTGRPNIAGSIATAGGLVFIGGAEDSRFRAYDARTGKEVWTVKMNASGSAVPATYQGRDGKQYVVITATGGSNSGAPTRSDEVVAFKLQ